MDAYKEFNFPKNRTYGEVMGDFLPNLADYYANPTKYNIEPFKIFGKVAILFISGFKKSGFPAWAGPFVLFPRVHI